MATQALVDIKQNYMSVKDQVGFVFQRERILLRLYKKDWNHQDQEPIDHYCHKQKSDTANKRKTFPYFTNTLRIGRGSRTDFSKMVEKTPGPPLYQTEQILKNKTYKKDPKYGFGTLK